MDRAIGEPQLIDCGRSEAQRNRVAELLHELLHLGVALAFVFRLGLADRQREQIAARAQAGEEERKLRRLTVAAAKKRRRASEEAEAMKREAEREVARLEKEAMEEAARLEALERAEEEAARRRAKAGNFPKAPGGIRSTVEQEDAAIAAMGLVMSESSEDFYDSGDGYLQPGQTVTVPGNGITLEVLSTANAPTSISVRITVESSGTPAVPALHPALLGLLAIAGVVAVGSGLSSKERV